jgi:hypothetical protein
MSGPTKGKEDSMSEDREERFVVTTDGRRIAVRPVAPVMIARIQLAAEKELRKAGVVTDKPTYTVTTVAGVVETHEHDEKSIQSPEEKEAWVKYLHGQKRLEALSNERTTKYALLEGLVIEPPSPEWAEGMQFFGVEMPTNPRDLKLQYIETEVLRTPEDMANAAMKILHLSVAGVDPEALAAAEASFRGKVERNSAKPVAPDAGTLGVQPRLPDGGDRQGVEPVAE